MDIEMIPITFVHGDEWEQLRTSESILDFYYMHQSKRNYLRSTWTKSMKIMARG